MTGRWILLALIIGSLASVGMADTPIKGNVWSNLDVQFYGFIKADASWDNSRTNNGNYVMWVDSETNSSGANTSGVAIKNDDDFNMTYKQTRFGVKIKAPQSGKYAVSGQMEWDLYGEDSYDNQNKAELQTRHAFITVKDVDTGWSLLAGQTWDVVSPLNPTTLNYTVLWSAGNYGYRRPQIRLFKTYDLGNGQSLGLTAAVARTIGGNSNNFHTDAGETKGYPQLQGRVAWTLPLINDLPATVGVSGHFGEEEYELNSAAPHNDETVSTWSTALDVTLPVTKTVAVKGELYRGSNLSSMLGGIGHGVDRPTNTSAGPEEIHNCGGWMAVGINPANAWSYNAGYGFTKNNQSDLENMSMARFKNSCFFANAMHEINKHASWGVEVSRWLTKYSPTSYGDGQAWRGQLSLILRN